MALAGLAGEDLDATKELLDSARPTAVNLAYATERMCTFGKRSKETRSQMFEEVERLKQEEFDACEKMAELAFPLFPSRPSVPGRNTVNVIHHCNTGGLATFGVGTALGCIVRRSQRNPNLFAWVDETRPRLQGSRLTSWELTKLKVPHKVIVDGAAGYVLASGEADCVFYGADRIAANGDVINKIGTYSLSVIARENGVPVYCVAPTSTIDLSVPDGRQVKIEERSDDEVFRSPGDAERFVDDASRAFNPAFDVTPFKYVTAIVTEEGVCYPPFHESVVQAKQRALAKQGVGKPGEDASTFRASKRSATSIFAPQNDPVENAEAALGNGRNDPRAFKPKTSLTDGLEEMAGNEEAAVANVRQFSENKKTTIQLGDDAEEVAFDTKNSVRVTRSKMPSNIFGDDVVDKRPEKAHVETPKPAEFAPGTKGRIETPQPPESLPSSKGHFDTPQGVERDEVSFTKGHFDSPKGVEHDETSFSKAHFDSPKGVERDESSFSKGRFDSPKGVEHDESSFSKGHFSPPTPQRESPQTKGKFAPSAPSNIFG